jgi:hypothetical protein
MRAQIPYLTRLARQAAGKATLLPPQQLFAGAAYTPVRSPGRDDSLRRRAGGTAAESFPGPVRPSNVAEEPPDQPGIAFPRGAGAYADQTDGAPEAPAGLTPDAGVPPIPAPSTARATGIPPTPRGLDVPRPPDLAPRFPPTAHRGSGPAPDTASVTAAHAGPVTQPVTPLPSSSSRPAGDTARAQPGSWTSPLRGTPANLPQAATLVPVTDDTDRRVPSRPGATAAPPGPEPAATVDPQYGPPRTEPGIPATPPPAPAPAATTSPHLGPPRTDAGSPATPPPGPGPAATARPPHGPPRTEPAITATPGGRNAADREHSGEPTTVRDLIPPPASAPLSITMSGSGPGEPHQKPRVPRPPRVTIGTIDVTVLPPAPPAPPAPGIRPPAQAARGWTRPPSLLAATAGAGRLRDGVRRWYGTAQG